MIRVDYRCRVCGVKQTDIVVEPDSTVTCPDCEDVTDVAVYLLPDVSDDDRSPEEIEAIKREESAAHDHLSE